MNSPHQTTRRRFLQRSLAAGALALHPAQAVRAAAPLAPLREAAPFGPALVISGSARERGRQYGRHFSDGIREFLEREINTAFIGKPAAKEDLLRYAGACWKVVQAECPVIAEEMSGMAEATGLRVEEHVLMTLHEELYHKGALPPVPHCTAVAVGRPETRDGNTFVGQTWDWMPSVAGLSTMLEWRRGDGPSVLAYAFPGLWVGAGMNSRGLALCWTSAELGKPKQMPRVGLPSYVLIAHLLYQESLDAVREVAQRNRQAGWFTFVMADGNGRLMNLEGSPEEMRVEELQGRLVRVGFGTRHMSRTPEGEAVKRHARCLKMDVQLDAAPGQTDLALLKDTFSDPTKGVCVKRSTIDLMVFDTSQRIAHLSRAQDYGVSWKELRFA